MPQVTLESNVTLPGFPHEIDFYHTSVANKVVVFLHGGGGQKYGVAFSLGLNLINAPPTAASVNWGWLNQNMILAVFPQGQTIYRSAYTWNNHYMDSGQDDVAFLKTLADYIRARYGVTDIYLAGHSNGGMMANRIWCEAPDTFKGYISMAGPASGYYLSASTPCAPSVAKPYYGIVGEQDNVLQVTGNWAAPTWQSNPLLTTPAHVDTTLIGEWSQHITRSGLMCNESPSLAGNVSDGAVETWRNCNGRLKLQHVLLGGHSIESLEMQSGHKMVDLIASFIGEVNSLLSGR